MESNNRRGYSATDLVRKVQETGAGEFVRKPYTMEKIGRAVKKEIVVCRL